MIFQLIKKIIVPHITIFTTTIITLKNHLKYINIRKISIKDIKEKGQVTFVNKKLIFLK